MTRIKRIGVLAFIALAIVGLSSINIKSAQASQQPASPQKSDPQTVTWSMTDNLETDTTQGDPYSRGWGCWVSAPDGYCTIYNPDPVLHHAYSGITIGEILAGNGGDYGGYTSFGRNVYIAPYQAGRTLQCAASFEVSAGFSSQGSTVSGGIDVIDTNSWTYVYSFPFTLRTSAYPATWQLVTTKGSWGALHYWNPPNPNVYVRIGVTGNTGTRPGFELDNLVVSCTY